MKYKLGARQRLDVRNILPVEGSYKEMKTTKAIHTKLTFNETEVTQWSIKQEGSQVSWNEEAVRDVEFTFSTEEVSLISKQLDRLDQAGKITIQHAELYDTFKGEG